MDSYRRGRPKWIEGVKGCFACRKNGMEKQHHSREEVSRSITMLNRKNLNLLLTQQDRAYNAEPFNEPYNRGETDNYGNEDERAESAEED